MFAPFFLFLVASALEIMDGRRDFPIRTLAVLCQWLRGCRVFFLKVLQKEAVVF